MIVSLDLQSIISFLSLVSSAITFYLVFFRYRHALKSVDHILSRWGKHMADTRWAKEESTRMTEATKSARSKLAKNVKAKIPFNVLENFNDDEVIGLLADKELVKGFLVIGSEAKEAIEKISDFFAGRQKPEKQKETTKTANFIKVIPP